MLPVHPGEFLHPGIFCFIFPSSGHRSLGVLLLKKTSFIKIKYLAQRVCISLSRVCFKHRKEMPFPCPASGSAVIGSLMVEEEAVPEAPPGLQEGLPRIYQIFSKIFGESSVCKVDLQLKEHNQ